MMNKFLIAATLTAIVALGAAPRSFAQGAQQTVTKVNVVAVAQGFRASKIDGSTVVNDHGDTIGKVDDVVVPEHLEAGAELLGHLLIGPLMHRTKFLAVVLHRVRGRQHLLVERGAASSKTLPASLATAEQGAEGDADQGGGAAEERQFSGGEVGHRASLGSPSGRNGPQISSP